MNSPSYALPSPLDPLAPTTVVSLCGGLLGEVLALALLGLPMSAVYASEWNPSLRAAWPRVRQACMQARPLCDAPFGAPSGRRRAASRILPHCRPISPTSNQSTSVGPGCTSAPSCCW
jgi:hypothetical protein